MKTALLTALLAIPLTTVQPLNIVHARGTVNTVIQPRSVGYFIGDLLQQQIAIDPAIKDLSGIKLPPNDRIGLWFERRNTIITTTPEGQSWITVNTQIINSPHQVIEAEIPALSIAMPEQQALIIPAKTITIAPLTPPPESATGAAASIRPDKSAPDHLIAAEQLSRNRWLAGLGLTLAIWVAWIIWRNRRDRKRQPFEQAWHFIRRRAQANQDPIAWQRLHQAINQSAGRTIRLNELEDFLAATAYLAPQREQIELFFEHSNKRFFAREQISEPTEVFDLLALSRELRRLEKQSSH
ncbi:MAG: hypothetical protein ACRBC3_01770 [Burkholderiaceae bacterium]